MTTIFKRHIDTLVCYDYTFKLFAGYWVSASLFLEKYYATLEQIRTILSDPPRSHYLYNTDP